MEQQCSIWEPTRLQDSLFTTLLSTQILSYKHLGFSSLSGLSPFKIVPCPLCLFNSGIRCTALRPRVRRVYLLSVIDIKSSLIVIFKKIDCMATDPVCGMNVKQDTPFVSSYDGNEYYLCSEGCKSSFEKNPQKYLKK